MGNQYAEHEFGKKSILAAIIVILGIFGLIGFYFYTSGGFEGSMTSTYMVGVFIFLSFVFGNVLLGVIRTRIFMYQDYFVYRTAYRTRDISFSDIASLRYIEHRGSKRVRYYVEVCDTYGDRLTIIPYPLFHGDERITFVNYLQDKKSTIDVDGRLLGDEFYVEPTDGVDDTPVVHSATQTKWVIIVLAVVFGIPAVITVIIPIIILIVMLLEIQ